MNEQLFWLGFLAAIVTVLCLLLLVRIQRLEGEPRPSLRDYYIAHAPAEPQPWFSPVLPPKEAPLLRFTDMYPDCTDEERGAINHFDSDYMDFNDVTEVRVRYYLYQKSEQQKRARAYACMAQRERLVQWPAAWADAVLNARSA